MTGGELMAVVGFGMAVFGTLFGIWRYLDGKLTAGRKETEAVARELAAHKLHTAETYVTKTGMQEQHAQVLKAIEAVGSRLDTRLDGFTERLDRAFERTTGRTTRG